MSAHVRSMQAVFRATPGRLADNRPEGEIWRCTLACGHETWTPRYGNRKPVRLKCDHCTEALLRRRSEALRARGWSCEPPKGQP